MLFQKCLLINGVSILKWGLKKEIYYFSIILYDCNELVKTFQECWITKAEVQFPCKDNLCQHVGEEFN